MENSVTPLETMRIASMGNLVTMPGFGDGDTITVRLRKPNLLTLMKSGKIPNQLMNTATELFQGTKRQGKTGFTAEELADIGSVMMLFCEASLVEPTYKEMADAGIELTAEQMNFIVSYGQGGVKSLESFRGLRENTVATDNGSEVAVPTESAT
jgi:hypothetical protein